MIVAGILKSKGYNVVCASPGDTIEHVTDLLAQHRIGAVLVVDASERLLGILSERDIVRALPKHKARTLAMTAADLMTRDVRTATPTMTVSNAMEEMTKGRFRHMPVYDRGALVGMISIGDVVKMRISETEHEVDSLKAYVAGA
ncbi:MAG TPA: CBS domain-containing protein [Acetobacteraceae bacterium]|nr:CBS domain-containing protein [Acetobacteraceae bacterium]